MRKDQHTFLLDLAKRCSYGEEIPFAHESFIYKLQTTSELSKEAKWDVLTSTNEIYYKSGEAGNPGCIVYQVQTGKGKDLLRKSLATGLPALLYNPQIFKQFLNIFLDKGELSTVTSLPFKRICALRSKSDVWESFVERYHELLLDLTVDNLAGLDDLDTITVVLKNKSLDSKGSKALRWVYFSFLPFILADPKGWIVRLGIENILYPLTYTVMQYLKEPAVQGFVHELKKEIYKIK